jgi:hypothetical protein
MDVIISLDDFYSGDTNRVAYDESKGIYADFENGTSRIVRFIFLSRGGWDQDAAYKWIRNRKLNKVYFRRMEDGKVFINSICLSAPVSKISLSDSESRVKSILGEGSFERLMAVENRHGSDKPFIVEVVAMDFKGKDFIVANGIKFFREPTIKMIEKFSNLSIRLGHPSLFDSYNKRVGNTIASFVDDDGNPATLSYINPHGEAADFREDLRIAEAQGNLESFEVSMFGDPVDYETVKDEDVSKEDGASVIMNEWNPTAQDFVDEGAIAGSRVLQIANTDLPEDGISNKKSGGSKVNISEILKALSEYKGPIALSDFLSVDAFKVAFDEHLKVKLSDQRNDLAKDDEFAVEILESCSDEVIDESKRIGKIVNNKVKVKRKQLEDKVEDIAKISEANEIELTEQQMFLVKNNIKGSENEEEILVLIKAAQMFESGIGVTKGLFTDPEKDDDSIKLSKRESHGAILEVVGVEEKTIVI